VVGVLRQEERGKVVPTDAAEDDDDPTGWKVMRESIGLAKDAGATTGSADHDATSAASFRRIGSTGLETPCS
jgi:hypothetical protein